MERGCMRRRSEERERTEPGRAGDANIFKHKPSVKTPGFHNSKRIRGFGRIASRWTSLIFPPVVRLRKISQTPRFPPRMPGDPRSPNGGRFDDSADARLARSAAKYGGVGLQFAASILLFLYAGQWVDRRFGTKPWGILIGVFVGAGAAFFSMYRRLMADLRREEEAQRK